MSFDKLRLPTMLLVATHHNPGRLPFAPYPFHSGNLDYAIKGNKIIGIGLPLWWFIYISLCIIQVAIVYDN